MLKIKDNIGWRKIGEKTIVFNPLNQELLEFNEIAAFLWDQLLETTSIEKLLNKVLSRYEVVLEQARKDVIDFIMTLSSLGFIDSTEPNISHLNYKPKKRQKNLLLQLEKYAIKKIIPFSVTFELTNFCNEDCIHCYVPRNNNNELETREIKRILSELADAGCLFISFTGGEIFTRLDIFEIIDFASKKRFVIDLLTNGALVDEKVISFLKTKTVRRVQISLYSATAQIHDQITQRKGSFLKSASAIEKLVKEGLKVEIAFPVMKLNFEQRHQVKKLAASLNARFLPAHIITARNDGSKDTFDLRLDNEQLQTLFKEDIFDYYPGRKAFQEHQFYVGFKNLQEANPCYSGINSCCIDPRGNLLPCNQFLYQLGNLRKNSFSKIWQNSLRLKNLRTFKVRDLHTCSKCELLSYCSRCPGLALLEGGDFLGPSFENCRITKIQTGGDLQ
ncbi:MAG: radical SAM protein [Candidatus Portnoybacteria bacterium]|nr:radical SAM protein [Candidatus Portnoybacteria bacterium]